LGSFDVRKCSETKNLWEVTNNTRSFSGWLFYYLLYKNTGSGLMAAINMLDSRPASAGAGPNFG
jgi:hypothetical protein